MSKFQFRFDDTEDCKLWVVSDLHLNHRQEFLWKPRGYKSAQDHTWGVINKINEVCRPQDILLNLGDFCLNTKYEEMEILSSNIKCTQWWLKGNHNNPWEKKYQKVCLDAITNDETGLDRLSQDFAPEITGYEFFDNCFIWGPYMEFMWNGQMCTFFHYPISVWNQMHHGSWNLCGHSHYSFVPSRADDFSIKQLDCGWDGHSGPLDYMMVRKIMDKKKVTQKDHHNKEVN